MTRVKRLYDMEIDEISLVDRPANQHGVVAIAKRYQEEEMSVYTADGAQVDEGSLEHGDVVYDEQGTEFVFVEDEDGEDEEVGKSSMNAVFMGAKSGLKGQDATLANSSAYRRGNAAGAFGRRNKKNIAIGAGGATAVGGGAYAMSKSFGDEVYEELSKALGQDDRDAVISKMADQVEIYKAQAEQALAVAENLAQEQEYTEYVELAKSYDLPGDAGMLGAILMNVSKSLPDDQLEYLDRLLSSAALAYDEIGTDGSQYTSNVLDQVNALAYEAVGKADVTMEQASVALFGANPAAYDEYLSESGR